MRAGDEERSMTEAENLGHRRGLLLRLLVTGMVLALWFWTQSLIGARTLPGPAIGDALHNWTAGLNSYFAENPGAANALLVVSSALIDALGLFLLGRWLFGGSVRPFLGLFLRSEEHTSELQSQFHLVCRLLLEKKKIECSLELCTTPGLFAVHSILLVRRMRASFLSAEFVFLGLVQYFAMQSTFSYVVTIRSGV